MSESVVRLCFCPEREDAERAGTFVREADGAWVFPLDAVRSMSQRAKYYAMIEREQFPHDDHTGEPYRHVTCPWCGLDLPGNVEFPDPAPFCNPDPDDDGN